MGISEGLAQSLSDQANELWSHLPVDEVGDDEELEVKTDALGRIMVRTDRAVYRLLDGVAYRCSELEGGYQRVEGFQNRQRVGFGSSPPPSEFQWN